MSISALLLLFGLAAAVAAPVAPGRSTAALLSATQQQIKLPGCIDDLYCVFPVTGAKFIAGQVFDAYTEVHGVAPLSTPTLEISLSGAPFVSVATLVPFTGAAVATSTRSWNFGYYSGSMAMFNNTAASSIQAGCTGVKDKLATCTSAATGYWWKRVAINAVGNHTVRLTVQTAGGADVRLMSWVVRPSAARAAKNVILFIGDGNNIPFITASRLVSRGQTGGKVNEKLYMQQLDKMGMVSTNGYDAIITDSANSAYSYSSGHKGVVNALGSYSNSDYYSVDTPSRRDDYDDPAVELITERIRRDIPGMAIGVVTTSEIQDATPAAWWGHSRTRYNKKETTTQVWTATNGYGPVMPDVLFGGGGYFFNGSYTAAGTPAAGGCLTTTTPAPAFGLPAADCYPYPRNLWTEAANPTLGNYSIVLDKDAMHAKAMKGGKLLGIWVANNEDTWVDRHQFQQNLLPANYPVSYNVTDQAKFQQNTTGQPDLSDATRTAIDVLSRTGGDKGFFLMVEGASIDKAEHPADFERAMGEQIDFDNAIGQAIAFSKTPAGKDTLIIVTADHAQAYDAWGTVDTFAFNAANNADGSDFPTMAAYYAAEAAKISAIGIYQGAGFPTYGDSNGDNFPESFITRYTLAQGKADGMSAYREDFQFTPKCVGSPCTRQPDISAAGSTSLGSGAGPDLLGLRMQGTSAPGQQTFHSLADVPLYASGPGSDLVRASMENTDVHYLMANALGLGSSVATYASSAPVMGGSATCGNVIPTFVSHATLGVLTTNCPAGSTFCVPSRPYVIGSTTYYPVIGSASSLNLQAADATCAVM